MKIVFLWGAVFLLGNVAVALGRVLRGPTPVDRLMAVQLFGTTGLGVVLLLAEALERPALRDVALVIALLAMVTTAAFVFRAGGRP